MGQSGSGKSTLAKLISFSEPKSGGKIYINSEEITDKNELKKDIRYILQNQKQALNPALKVKTAIAHVRSYLKLSFSENELKELLANLNLKDEILEKYPSQLSGGEASRVQIALALCLKPKILICDEITSGLDSISASHVADILESLKGKMSVIFISHDEALTSYLSDEIWQMRDGRLNLKENA